MKQTWQEIAELLTAVKVVAHPDNAPVSIEGVAEGFRCIGVGTDAAVFQFLKAPEYAFKLYAEDKWEKLEAEASVYAKIGDSSYFSTCYGVNEQLLVIKYEDGLTLFDCLLQGVHIPDEVVQDVEEARTYIRQIGLNPRDIHLKNILLQNGRAKLLDVSEYVKPGNDFRWEHLKKAHEEYYTIIDGRPMPFWLLDTVRKWYHHWNRYSTSFDEFMKTVSKQMSYWK